MYLVKISSKFIALLYVSLLLTVVTTSCATSKKKPADLSHTDLTQAEAITRFAQVSDVKYDLEFDLKQQSPLFSGSSTIKFNYKPSDKNLRIDFYKGNVVSVSVNGEKNQANYNGRYLTLENSWLKPGANVVKIEFKKEFNTDGRGFVRFQDPEDQRVYTYTHLEPFRANFVFPCFDQPDLKATYKMLVAAPKSWQVITSVLESKTTDTADGRKLWNFPQSAKFSTYIWSLHAGEYDVFKSKFKDIPLRLFVRKSLAKYVKTKDWFRPTKQGLRFFPKYFGTAYPYKKYDSIIAPAYNSGAMENVAAVTFNEQYVRRGPKQRRDRRRLASVIMHEMAHMWFGNLVTMKWWNDLWLNESFATYMAALALHDATEYKEAWRGFNGRKQWAYWEDQLVTTHPIEANIPDTATAITNFDGITYGKGAASMKQLAYYIGPKKFQKGLQIYFKRFAEQNTELKDFIGALSEGAGKDLKEWQKSWLQTANLNTIEVKRTCENNKVTEAKVLQTYPAEYPTLRPHRFEVAFLGGKRSLKVKQSFPVTVTAGSADLPQAKGMSCDAIVDPNYKDYGYFKSKLDKTSVDRLKRNIVKVRDDFQRQLFWTSLWQMVRDGELDTYSYSDIVLANVHREKDDINLRQVLASIYGGRGRGSLYYMPTTTDEQKALANEYALKAEKLYWQQLQTARVKSDRQKIWFDAFVSVARTDWGLGKVSDLVAKKQIPKGLTIDQDRRWHMIYQLSSYGRPESKELITAELKADGSDKGKKQALSAQAAFPSWESKRAWIAEIKNKDTTYKVPELRRVMRSLFPENQDELRAKYGKSFYKDLSQVIGEKSSFFATYYSGMGPEVCQETKGAVISDFLIDNKKLHPTIKRKLRIRRQEAERCHKVRMTAAKASRSVASEK